MECCCSAGFELKISDTSRSASLLWLDQPKWHKKRPKMGFLSGQNKVSTLIDLGFVPNPEFRPSMSRFRLCIAFAQAIVK